MNDNITPQLEKEIEHYKEQVIFSQKASRLKSERSQHLSNLLISLGGFIYDGDEEARKEVIKFLNLIKDSHNDTERLCLGKALGGVSHD